MRRPRLDGGYGQVAITIVAVLVGFIVIAAAILWLGNWRRDARSEPLSA